METQTQTQRTPGPWSVYPESGNVMDGRGCRVATIVRMPGQNEHEKRANAALIASAPELYEALSKLREVVGCWNLNSQQYESLLQPVIRDVDAALAHADNKDYHPREVQA